MFANDHGKMPIFLATCQPFLQACQGMPRLEGKCQQMPTNAKKISVGSWPCLLAKVAAKAMPLLPRYLPTTYWKGRIGEFNHLNIGQRNILENPLVKNNGSMLACAQGRAQRRGSMGSCPPKTSQNTIRNCGNYSHCGQFSVSCIRPCLCADSLNLQYTYLFYEKLRI